MKLPNLNQLTDQSNRPGPVRVLQAFAVVILAAGMTIALIGMSSQPAIAASISISDVSVTTNDGELSSVTINPSLTVSWSGFERNVSTLSTLIYINNQSSSVGSYYSKACDYPDCKGTSGSKSLDFAPLNIINASGYDAYDNSTRPTAADFAVADGDTNSTTVYLQVRVLAYDSSNNLITSYDQDLSFTVTHTNEATNTSVEGSIDTGASG